MEKGVKYLEKNLCDSIFEMMLKFNETHNDNICMYYIPELAAYLLDCNIEDLPKALQDFQTYIQDSLGDVRIETASDGRIGIRVFSDSIDKIMQTNPRKDFLKKLVEVIRTRDCTIDPIKKVFEEESDNFECIKVDNSEFQYVVYFKDEKIDEYRYCFTFDIMGSYYHRFIEYDFENLIHDDCDLDH